MVIDISKTEHQVGESFEVTLSEDLPDFNYNGSDYKFSEPVTFNGIYLVEAHGIGLIGSVKAALLTPCVRCLSDAAIVLNIDINEAFRSGPPDEETYGFDGHTVDIGKAVMDNITLNLPLNAYCKPDCKGLCPYCGIDLNRGTCDCQQTHRKASSPFDKLGQMFSDESKD